MTDFFVREYLSESSSFQISWIGSVQVLFLGCSGIPGGYAMDHGYLWVIIALSLYSVRLNIQHSRWVMISGSILLTFCLVMTSFCQEQKFWQVWLLPSDRSFSNPHKMFLADGLGLGIAVGMLYVPAIGVLSHHFKKRRSLMMGLAQAGSSVGGLVHPIMLNNLFHGRLGFAWGVRASALFNFVLLIIANLLMTTRLPARPKDTTLKKQLVYWKSFFTDKLYVLATLSVFILYCGVYFPTFFLQLDAVENGLSESLAFYSVGCPSHSECGHTQERWLDHSTERSWCTRSNYANNRCRPRGRLQHDDSVCSCVWYLDLLMGGHEGCSRRHIYGRVLWLLCWVW